MKKSEWLKVVQNDTKNALAQKDPKWHEQVRMTKSSSKWKEVVQND